MDVAEDIQVWITEFRAKHGRPPRVLHLGNIANNAYYNAKMMRQMGIDCDVVSYDYYHTMACPEWEEADFDGVPFDQMRPDWTRMDLQGYERPQWFVAGPDILCIRYLLWRRSGRRWLARRIWRALQLSNGTRRRATLSDYLILAVQQTDIWARRQLHGLLTHRKPWDAALRRMRRLEVRAGKTVAIAAAAGIYAVAMILRVANAIAQPFTAKQRSLLQDAQRVSRLYAEEFADRGDSLEAHDVMDFQYAAERWRRLFRAYDVVQGYSTDPMLPFFCEHPYFAFEHGTLRDIPFERSPRGRLTALAYRRARHVFVTNSDCMDKAKYLAGERVTFINHPYDETQPLDESLVAKAREELRRDLDASFIFFFPARHAWAGTAGEKANDVFLRAFCRLRAEGYRVGLVCCDWGVDVAASRELIAAGHCTAYVRWLMPMGNVRFGRMARACDLVADQFRLGAFGGVMFKALAAGAPVMTFLDVTQVRKVYPTPPPVINCRTEDQIFEESRRVLEDPKLLVDLAASSKAWIKKYHRGVDTAYSQIAQYRRWVA